MAYGDALMATARVRGFDRPAAFFNPDDKPVNNRKIFWTDYCEDIFRNNPNVARPGQHGEFEWLPHYKKRLAYCSYNGVDRLIWNNRFKAQPGEMFFSDDERLPPPVEQPFVMIEPNVAWQRPSAVNKDWGAARYEELAKALIYAGHRVVQCIHPRSQRKLDVHQVPTQTFRQAIWIMSQASVVVAPEGANHHAAAAVDVPAVILWGGWSPQKTMGYGSQIMFGTHDACGSAKPCAHCRAVFDAISVDEVYWAVLGVHRWN